MSEEVVEQITRDPPKEKTEGNTSKKREKDPKKVAAGKKLAEYNKKAKEALARETQRAAEQMKREKEQEEIKNENTESESNKAWLPELSFTTVLSIVGIGFTAFDMFMRYRQNRETTQPPQTSISVGPAPLNIPVPQPQPTPKSIGSSSLKMGMI